MLINVKIKFLIAQNLLILQNNNKGCALWLVESNQIFFCQCKGALVISDYIGSYCVQNFRFIDVLVNSFVYRCSETASLANVKATSSTLPAIFFRSLSPLCHHFILPNHQIIIVLSPCGHYILIVAVAVAVVLIVAVAVS